MNSISPAPTNRRAFLAGTTAATPLTALKPSLVSGAKDNIREFHQFITQGQCDNPTVAPSVRSNLTAVLGREAGCQAGEVTLAGLIMQGKRLSPDLRGAEGLKCPWSGAGGSGAMPGGNGHYAETVLDGYRHIVQNSIYKV